MSFEPLATINKTTSRIPKEEMFKRDRDVFKLGIPSAAGFVNKYRGQNQKLIICGGGPSLKDTLRDIKKQRKLSKKIKVMAVNKTHDWLISKGIKPDFGVMIDPKPWCEAYMTPHNRVTYLLGAKVHPDVWKRFEVHPRVYHWHPWELIEESDILNNEFSDHPGGFLLIPGQSTVGLRCVPLGYEMGFRKFELHGFDSSKSGEDTHAYEKHSAEEVEKYNPFKDNPDELVQVKGDGEKRTYVCIRQMARQIEHFKTMIQEFDTLEKQGIHEYSEILVSGTGALPYLSAAGYGLHVRDDWNATPSLMPK